MSFKLCILLVVSIFVVNLAEGQQKSCRAVFSDMNKRQLGWINQCVKQLGYKTGREKTQKSTCVMKCVLKNLDMLSADGYLDEVQFDKFLIEQWPQHMIDRANTTFQPCRKVIGLDVNTQDEFCKGYDPLVKCLTRNFANLCRGA